MSAVLARIMAGGAFLYLATVAFPASVAAQATCSVDERGGASHADGSFAGGVSQPVGTGPFPAILELLGPEGFSGPVTVARDYALGDFVTLSRGGLGGGPMPPSPALQASRLQELERLLACVQSLPNVDPERIGVVAFSEAGYYAWLLASHPSVSAVVTWNAVIPIDSLAADSRTPVLVQEVGHDADFPEASDRMLDFLFTHVGRTSRPFAGPRPALPAVADVPGRPSSPDQPGPFAVGTTTRTFTRTTDAGLQRTLPSRVFYPAARAGDDAPTALSEAPYPVLFYSHGSGGTNGRPGALPELSAQLASHGLIVVGPGFPDAVRECSECPWIGTGSIAQRQAANGRLADLPFLVQQVESLNGSDALLRGMLDISRMGLIGHSFGGVTSLYLLEEDERFRAAVAMAPGASAVHRQRMINGLDQLAAPMMVMLGGQDIETPPARIEPWWTRGVAEYPRWLVSFPRANHYVYGRDCPATSPDCGPDYPYDPLPYEAAAPHVHRWTTAFLLTYVAGNPVYLDWLDPTVGEPDPEVTVRVAL